MLRRTSRTLHALHLVLAAAHFHALAFLLIVTHAAITENKRLSEALALAKEIQDAKLADEAVKIGKQRTKYTPTGRKPPGPKGRLEKAADRRRAEAAARTQHAAE